MADSGLRGFGAAGPPAPTNTARVGQRGAPGPSGLVPETVGIPVGPSPAVTPVARVRKKFPEAWIWTETNAG